MCYRKYEYPERDVPHQAAIIGRGGGGPVTTATGEQAAASASSLHVTNLVIDKTPTRAAHNLSLPVPSHPQQVIPTLHTCTPPHETPAY